MAGGLARGRRTAAATTTNDTQKAQQNFRELLGKFHQAMLVTQSPQAGLRSRPMGIADHAEDGTIWFITGQDTSNIFIENGRFHGEKIVQVIADRIGARG